MTRTALVYAAAALAEIAGCYGFWLCLREGKPLWLLAASLVSLSAFAWLLTLSESNAAGRAFAAYGGVYIVASILWLWRVENVRPDRWDVVGSGICLLGAAVILFAPRHAVTG